MGELATHQRVAGIVVYGGDGEGATRVVVQHGKEPELSDQTRREELRDETLVLEIAHGEIEGRQPVAAGDVREPESVLGIGTHADALDVAHHLEAQSIRVDAAIARILETRLQGYAGMGFEEFQHEARTDQAFFEHPIQ